MDAPTTTTTPETGLNQLQAEVLDPRCARCQGRIEDVGRAVVAIDETSGRAVIVCGDACAAEAEGATGALERLLAAARRVCEEIEQDGEERQLDQLSKALKEYDEYERRSQCKA